MVKDQNFVEFTALLLLNAAIYSLCSFTGFFWCIHTSFDSIVKTALKAKEGRNAIDLRKLLDRYPTSKAYGFLDVDVIRYPLQV